MKSNEPETGWTIIVVLEWRGRITAMVTTNIQHATTVANLLERNDFKKQSDMIEESRGSDKKRQSKWFYFGRFEKRLAAMYQDWQ